MATSIRMDRLRQAIAGAAEGLARQDAARVQRTGPPAPGDLYVLDSGIDVALEWLVVREHPHDPELLLVVPTDDFPLAGTPDVSPLTDNTGRAFTARCGAALWLPRVALPPHLRVGSAPEEAVRRVRQRFAELCRGELSTTPEQEQADVDPEYEIWIGSVERAGEVVERWADGIPVDRGAVILFSQLSLERPASLPSTHSFSLAAQSGDPLAPAVNQALHPPTRYHEIAVDGKGELILMVNDHGVRGAWCGENGSPPPRFASRDESGQRREASWIAGPQGRLHRTEPPIAWENGRIVLEIGTEAPQTLTLQR